jgi:3-hydroxymyristoyl/3-hydroxydecanoyl-(acyl carrier protein) dehydratase
MNKLLPDILSAEQQGNSLDLQLFIPADLYYFSGHFPNQPVLAGVVQLHWVVEFCQQYFPDLKHVLSVEVLKFQVMVKPDSQLELSIEQNKAGVVLFSFSQQQQKVASGRLKWELHNSV